MSSQEGNTFVAIFEFNSNILGWTLKMALRIWKALLNHHHTVGGRNSAPADMVTIPLFAEFYTSQVVQDLFHPIISIIIWISTNCTSFIFHHITIFNQFFMYLQGWFIPEILDPSQAWLHWHHHSLKSKGPTPQYHPFQERMMVLIIVP